MTRGANILAAAAAILISVPVFSDAASYKSLAKRLAKAASSEGITRVAVASFVSMDGSDPSEGRHIAERLATRLSGRKGVRVVERGLLPSVMDEHLLGRSGFMDEDRIAPLGRLLQAEAVVAGSFVTIGNTVELNVRLVRIDTGEILASRSLRLKRDWYPSAVIPRPAPFSADDAVADVVEFQTGRRYSPHRDVRRWMASASPRAAISVRRSGFGDVGALRDAVADRCSGARERIDAMQESILEIKARYWAHKARKKGFSARKLAARPGAVMSDPGLRLRFFELMRDAADRRAAPLSMHEVKRFIEVDRRSFELHAACGL